MSGVFQLPVFPEALFFSGVRGKADTALMAAGTLVDIRKFYGCFFKNIEIYLT